MSIQYRQILELYGKKKAQRNIAAMTGNSRAKVAEVIHQANAQQLHPLFTDTMDDQWFEAALFPNLSPAAKGRQLPDFESIHKELAKPNVTLSLLHQEYEDSCRQAGVIPYAYRTFCQYYNQYAQRYKATMRIRRKPKEIMEVDWAGSHLNLIDKTTGDLLVAYLFLATLPSSQYAYCEARLSTQEVDWITCHIHAYEFFGGVTEVLVPDNLKTGITKHSKREIIINPTYRELAEHYGTVIMPARVRTPKDKATVEDNVKNLSTWVIAALRNEIFSHWMI